MKSFYKKCEIEGTAVYVSPAKRMLTPRVEIQCEKITEPHWLTTKETFKSAREAELRRDDGAEMD